MKLINKRALAIADDCSLIYSYLDRILNSPAFANAPKQRILLRYLVQMSCAGNGSKLKGYTIAVEALGANPEFDSNHDSSVRVSVKRLREHLFDYYGNLGESDEVRFVLGVGSYEIIFLGKITNVSEHSEINKSPYIDRRKTCGRRKSDQGII